MSKQRLLCASLFALSGILAGCGGDAPPSTSPVQSASLAPKTTEAGYPVPSFDAPDTVPPTKHLSPDAAARQATDYANRAQQGSGGRPASAQTAAGSAKPDGAPAPVASDVKFLDPSTHQHAAASTVSVAPNPSAVPDVHVQANTQVASISPVVPVAPPAVSQTPPRAEAPFNKDTPAVNTPLIVGQPRPLPATDDLAQKFAQQAQNYPHDIAAQLDWQLLQFLQGQSVPQLQSLALMPAEDRELLSALLDGLSNFRNGVKADNNMLLSRKIRPLVELADRLKTQAELTIPTLALCTDVKGFGVYEPIEPARFTTESDHRVIVYCEVENFSSLLDAQRRWETRLTQEVVLYTEQGGEEVWRDKAPPRPIIDYSRNRRHDFFIVKMIRLPKELSLGRYLLKVTVVDTQMNRVAENSIPVQIVAPN